MARAVHACPPALLTKGQEVRSQGIAERRRGPQHTVCGWRDPPGLQCSDCGGAEEGVIVSVEFGISRKTGYKIPGRYNEIGLGRAHRPLAPSLSIVLGNSYR
jgi:hypothetical protein